MTYLIIHSADFRDVELYWGWHEQHNKFKNALELSVFLNDDKETIEFIISQVKTALKEYRIKQIVLFNLEKRLEAILRQNLKPLLITSVMV